MQHPLSAHLPTHLHPPCLPPSPAATAPPCKQLTVRAVGLNFRDVLNVLGMYPGDPGQPGGDCAGVVDAVGAGVEGIAPGELRACALCIAVHCNPYKFDT